MDQTRIKVQIKGIKEGLLISLGEGSWEDLQENLLSHIREQSGFFQGARIAIETGNVILRAAEMGVLRDRLNDLGVSLYAVLSNSPTTEQSAQMLGLATRLSSPRAERVVKPLDTNMIGEEAVLLHRTLRSGFKVTSHGHIVVIGDVNPGAEIIAGGNIVIWGRLRGVVHAGAEGNENAMVCALDLIPTQLRIAGLIAIPPQRKSKPQPEVARIRDGQVIAEPWNIKEGGK
jgi:septum site-determining protein MinC